MKLPSLNIQIRSNLIIMGLIASLFGALFRAIDNVVMNNVIVAEERLIAVGAYMALGSWVGCLSGVAFALLLGQRFIDPKFPGLRPLNLPMQVRAIKSGLLSSFALAIYLWTNQDADPGVVSVLTSFGLVYLVVYELRAKSISTSGLMPLIILSVVGSVLGSIGDQFTLDLGIFVLIFIVHNSLGTASSVFEQEGSKLSDGVNFFIARFFWLAVFSSCLAGAYAIAVGHTQQFFITITASINVLPLILFAMFFVFVSSGLRFTLNKENALTEVAVVMSMAPAFALVITVVGNYFNPELFSKVPNTPEVWLIRLLGIMLLVASLAVLRYRKAKLIATSDSLEAVQ